MSDLDTLETELRRMLKRRAADIDSATGPTPVSSAPTLDRSPPAFGSTRRRGPVVVAAAAAIALVILGVALTSIVGRDDVGRITTAVEDEADDGKEIPAASSDTEEPPTGNPGEGESSAEPEPAWTYESAMDAALRLLPPGFDPLSSPPVAVDYSPTDPREVAERYILARGLAAPETELIGRSDELSIHRWSSAGDGGFVILRLTDGDRVPELVAVTTDGIAANSVERTDQRWPHH